MANTFLNRHFNGPYCQAIADGIQGSFSATDEFTTYLKDLDIDNAEEQECEWIGLWIGFPRPFIPDELLIGNALLLYKIADQMSGDSLPFILPFELHTTLVYSLLHGLSSLSQPLVGGRLISLVSTLSKLPLDIYKQILKSIAFIKWNGWNFLSLDNLIYQQVILQPTLTYTFTWDALNDVVITFSENIDPIFTYIFELIINIFSTLPRITLIGA